MGRDGLRCSKQQRHRRGGKKLNSTVSSAEIIPQASASFFEVRRGRIIIAALHDRPDGAKKVSFTATATFQPGVSFIGGPTPALGLPHRRHFITTSSFRLFICKEEPNLINVSIDK